MSTNTAKMLVWLFFFGSLATCHGIDTWHHVRMAEIEAQDCGGDQ